MRHDDCLRPMLPERPRNAINSPSDMIGEKGIKTQKPNTVPIPSNWLSHRWLFTDSGVPVHPLTYTNPPAYQWVQVPLRPERVASEGPSTVLTPQSFPFSPTIATGPGRRGHHR